MNEKLRAELAAAARRMGMTDELVGRLRPLFQVAYEAGKKDAQTEKKVKGEKS